MEKENDSQAAGHQTCDRNGAHTNGRASPGLRRPAQPGKGTCTAPLGGRSPGPTYQLGLAALHSAWLLQAPLCKLSLKGKTLLASKQYTVSTLRKGSMEGRRQWLCGSVGLLLYPGLQGLLWACKGRTPYSELTCLLLLDVSSGTTMHHAGIVLLASARLRVHDWGGHACRGARTSCTMGTACG